MYCYLTFITFETFSVCMYVSLCLYVHAMMCVERRPSCRSWFSALLVSIGLNTGHRAWGQGPWLTAILLWKKGFFSNWHLFIKYLLDFFFLEKSMKYVYFYFFYYWSRDLLYNPGWPRTYSVKHKDPLASVSRYWDRKCVSAHSDCGVLFVCKSLWKCLSPSKYQGD